MESVALSLSGGGFRASLFHIGALMKLAETGLLQRTTTLSTVSGGSIIGMLYYLHLKYLLETKSDIQPEDLIDVVKNVDKEFRKAMKKDIIFLPFRKKSAKMLEASFKTSLTRTNILSEIYQEEIYKNIWNKIVDFWKSQSNRPEEWKDVDKDSSPYLNRLKIYPKSVFENGSLDYDSFHYEKHYNQLNFPIKIPDLVINSTNLNTGKLWRFSATKFGEYLSLTEIFSQKEIRKKFEELCQQKEFIALRSKYGLEKLIDLHTGKEDLEQFYNQNNLRQIFSSVDEFKNGLKDFLNFLLRFRDEHLYDYKDISKQRITIGEAVASSACVPGVFAPFVYEDKGKKYVEIYGENVENIKLVDGGVYDNQGLESVYRKFTKRKIRTGKNENLGLVFCSDASGQMNVDKVGSMSVKVVSRSTEVQGDRLRLLTINKLYEEKNQEFLKFILIHLKQYVKKPIKEPPILFPEDLAELNSRIRTHLNIFWDEEINSLIVHGYALSEYYLYRFVPEEINEISLDFRTNILKIYSDIQNRKEFYKKILRASQSKLSTIKIFFIKKFFV